MVFPKFAVIQKLPFSTAGKLEPEKFGFVPSRSLEEFVFTTCRKVAFLQGPDLDKFCFPMPNHLSFHKAEAQTKLLSGPGS